ncbi:MAG: sulfurtransferase TusA family protein [Nitrospirae bacterium]|nr:sulfurtransferase TusA family protein [Nitrospirota bacterium]MBI3352694.1 sulfurtransferase TusA family protein [Nitrospirota bacterium]
MMSVQADIKLDCKGLSCPLPVIKTKKAIDGMQVGQILEMVATDPGSVNDMKAWSHRTGHELVDQKQDNGFFIFFIKKVK